MGIWQHKPHLFPHERDQLEVFLIEDEMHSPWARLRVGDALFTEGFSQGFRSTEENSYSGTFGKKERKKKDSFRLCNAIDYIARSGDFQMILGPRAENPLLLCLSHKWLSSDCAVGELLSPVCEGSRTLQMAVPFPGKCHSSKVYGNFYHRFMVVNL